MQQDQLKDSEYCHQKAAPPGSSIYYSLLGEEPDKKEQLITLHAFHSELREVVSHCSDPGLARIKLAWWREEIQRMLNHQQRHPVTRNLVHLSMSSDGRFLCSLIDHYEKHLDFQQPENYQGLIDFLQQGPGLFWQHLAGLSCHVDPATPSLVGRMGNLFTYFDLLQELPLHTRQQRNYIPRCKGQEQTDNKTLIQMQIKTIADELDAMLNQLPAVDYQSLGHVLILAQIVLATCREIKKSDCDLQLERISLTPLRKLWIAWKSKFKY